MSTLQLSPQSNDRKLPVRVLFGYPLVNFGTNLQTMVQIFFLVYFYTDILGIGGVAASAIILIARCWDFINDPIMGIIVEKTGKKPGGKSLWFMKRALVPTVIFFILMYAAPNFSFGMKVAWGLITYIGLGMCQTAFSIPYQSLRPKLTRDGAQRQKLNIFETVFSAITNIAVPAVTMPLFAILSGFGVSTAFMKLAAIYAVIYLLCGIAGLLLLKGQEPEEEAPAETLNKPKISGGEMLKALLTNKMAMIILLAQVMKMFFSSLGGSVMVYYCQYNLENPALMTITSSLGILTYLPTLFLVPLYKKFGNAGIGMLGEIIGILCMVVRFVTHDGSDMIYITMYVAGGFGTSLSTAVMMQCLMDSLDYGEWKTGHRNTSVIMSAMGIGNKIGMAFGATVTAFIIGLVGYEAGAAVQSESTINAFYHLSVTGPMIMEIVLFIAFFFIYKVEKRLPQMKAEIAERAAGNADSVI